MRKLKINRMNFELAFELGSYETTSYLDTVNGDVLLVEEDASHRLEKLLTGEDNLEAWQLCGLAPIYPTLTASNCWMRRGSKVMLIIVIA